MLSKIIEELGFECKKETTESKRYTSPFRPEEKTPSFYVLNTENGYTNFKDYGNGLGGDIYKFLMEYYKITFIEAKERLKEMNFKKNKDLNEVRNEKKKDYQIVKIFPLGRRLKRYLYDRKIKNNYDKVQELYFIDENKKQRWGIIFMNDSRGFEFRSKFSKRTFLTKDITTISTNQTRLKIFEGFMDYLSYLEMTKAPPIFDYIILNSVSLREKVLNAVQSKYETIELYLDNDKAGDETTEYFLKNLPKENIIDKRGFYKKFKDVNEYLMNS